MEYRKATAEDIDLISEIRRVQLIHEQAHEEVEIRKNLKAFFEKAFADNRIIQILAEEDGIAAATGASSTTIRPAFPIPPVKWLILRICLRARTTAGGDWH